MIIQAQDAMKHVNSPRSLSIFSLHVPGAGAGSIGCQAVRLVTRVNMASFSEGKWNRWIIKRFLLFQVSLVGCTGNSELENGTSLSNPDKMDICLLLFSYVIYILLASKPHAMHSFHSWGGLVVTLLSLLCLLLDQVDQSLLHWQRALGAWEGQWACWLGHSPTELVPFQNPKGDFSFLVEQPLPTLHLHFVLAFLNARVYY